MLVSAEILKIVNQDVNDMFTASITLGAVGPNVNDGFAVGFVVIVGLLDGFVGCSVLGLAVGIFDVVNEGLSDTVKDGFEVTVNDGTALGEIFGIDDGAKIGVSVGWIIGLDVGSGVGASLGSLVGDSVGAIEGS